MDYIIKNKNDGYYFPKIDMWVLDDLKLDLRQAMLYTMIMNKGYFTWTSDFTGKVLRCSGKTVLRTLEDLERKKVITRKLYIVNGKRRSVCVALYTVEGKRNPEQIIRLLDQGKQKLFLNS